MLLVVAALWLWVFVPSWVKQSERKESRRDVKKIAQQELRDSRKKIVRGYSAAASMTYRLTWVRRIFALLALLSLGLMISFANLLAVSPLWAIAIFPLALLLVGSTLVVRKATKRIEQLSLSAISSKSDLFAKLALRPHLNDSEVEQRGWTRQELPQPKQSIATVEQVEVATVEQIRIKPKVDVNVDEILRRRRSNG